MVPNLIPSQCLQRPGSNDFMGQERFRNSVYVRIYWIIEDSAGSGPVLDRLIPRKQIIPPRQQRQLQRDKDGFIRTDHSSVAGNRHDVSLYPPVTGTRRARTRLCVGTRPVFFKPTRVWAVFKPSVGSDWHKQSRHKSINVSCLILRGRWRCSFKMFLTAGEHPWSIYYLHASKHY